MTNGRHSHPPSRTPRAVAEARAFAKQNDYCRGTSDEGPGIEPWMGRKSYFADDIYTRLYPIKTNLSWSACEYLPNEAVCSNATNATTPDQKCGDGAYVNCEFDTSGQCVPKPEDAVTCPTPDPYLDDEARLIPSAPAWHSRTHTPPARRHSVSPVALPDTNKSGQTYTIFCCSCRKRKRLAIKGDAASRR